MGIGSVVSGGADLNGLRYPADVTLCTPLSVVNALQCDAYRLRDAPTVSPASVWLSALVAEVGGAYVLESGTLWLPPLLWVGSRPSYLLLPVPPPCLLPWGSLAYGRWNRKTMTAVGNAVCWFLLYSLVV